MWSSSPFPQPIWDSSAEAGQGRPSVASRSDKARLLGGIWNRPELMYVLFSSRHPGMSPSRFPDMPPDMLPQDICSDMPPDMCPDICPDMPMGSGMPPGPPMAPGPPMMPFGPEEMPPGPPAQDFYEGFYQQPEGMEMDPTLMGKHLLHGLGSGKADASCGLCQGGPAVC